MMVDAANIEAVEFLILDVPTIRPHGLSVATMQSHEFHAENRPHGGNFWLKAAFRF